MSFYHDDDNDDDDDDDPACIKIIMCIQCNKDEYIVQTI